MAGTALVTTLFVSFAVSGSLQLLDRDSSTPNITFLECEADGRAGLSQERENSVGRDAEDTHTSATFPHRHSRQRRQERGTASGLPTPSSPRATVAGPHTIVLEWQYGGRLGGVEFLVKVYSEGSFIKDQVVHDTTARVTGLVPSTNYDLTVSAVKPLPMGRRATSAVSDTVSATTSEFQLPAPGSVRVTSVSHSSVQLQWQYGDRLGGVEFLVKVYSEGSFIKDQVVQDTTVHVTGLAPSTNYDLTVTAVKPLPMGRRATSAVTNAVSATTPELRLATPSNFRVTSTDLSSITLQWQYGDQRDGGEFLVKVYSEGSFIKDQVVHDTTVHVTGLAPNTNYDLTVSAVKPLPMGRRATSAVSDTVSATTNISPLPVPSLSTVPPPTSAVLLPTIPTRVTASIVTVPSNQSGGGVCSLETSPGVSVQVLSCRWSHSLLPFARTGECGEVGKALVETVVLADCWGVATLVLRCHADGRWHSYGTHLANASPTSRLCQYHTLNSPVCGRRAWYQKPKQGPVLLRPQPNWPWLVGLFVREQYSCTATLINPHYLLTAAHCLARTQESMDSVDLRDLRVQHVGSGGTIQSQYVAGVWLVPSYEGGARPKSDVGLVKVERALTFSSHLHPACIATHLHTPHPLAATFSRNKKQYLWKLVVQQPDPRCSSQQDVCTASLRLHLHQFCAIDIEGKLFLMEGSSGGPYLVNRGNDAQERWEVAGLVSSSHSHTHCSVPVTVFTSLPYYWSWLADCVHEGKCDKE